MLTELEAIPMRGGEETILIAEDDAAVRDTAVALLAGLGYRVLKARDAAGALSIIESGVQVDLLFSDVVMPGPLTATELARKAIERQPALKVLFTSGYTENAIVHGGRLDSGVSLLGKPYTREALAAKVRQVLGSDGNALPSPPSPQASPPAPPPEQAEETLVVLVCEDDALIRMSTVDMLQEMGLAALEAGTAGAALDLVRARRIDVLLTDVGLPDFSGVELADQAVALQPHLTVVFATGRNEMPQSAVADPLLLVKPYEFDALARAMATAQARR